MNSEIKKLQFEINKLRKQNIEKQKQIKYIPLNIISNNLYINNSLNNKTPSKKISYNNSRYNSFMKYNQNHNNSSLSLNFKPKKIKSYKKFPFKKGMFSYKNSLKHSNPYNYKYNITSNKYNYKGSNNNSLLSANLKLNLDNDDNENNLSQNIINHGRIYSSSSFDLNKYKITDKNINSLMKSNRNISLPSILSKNTIPKANTNNNISHIFHKNTNTLQNNTLLLNNIYNKNKLLPRNQNSMDTIKISPIIPNLKEQNSNSLIIIDDYNNMPSNTNNKKRKIYDHYLNNPKNEKESRRMIIEYIKILNRQNHKNNQKYIHGNIDSILEKNNISKKVLNKEYIAKEFNSMNIFSNSNIINRNNKTFSELNLNKSYLSSSLLNNFNNSVMSLNNNVLSKNFHSPIKNNINNFLINMNDEKTDKINMIKFLSTPKIMNLYFLNNKYKYIFFLCPNILSYINGVESYIFKFIDIRNLKPMGGFDLIKVNLCSINNKNPNNFFIETFDGKKHRNYEFETSSKDMASEYVKSINYLSQLEKCKIYNYKKITD